MKLYAIAAVAVAIFLVAAPADALVWHLFRQAASDCSVQRSDSSKYLKVVIREIRKAEESETFFRREHTMIDAERANIAALFRRTR